MIVAERTVRPSRKRGEVPLAEVPRFGTFWRAKFQGSESEAGKG
jgi:hypothetical protein